MLGVNPNRWPITAAGAINTAKKMAATINIKNATAHPLPSDELGCRLLRPSVYMRTPGKTLIENRGTRGEASAHEGEHLSPSRAEDGWAIAALSPVRRARVMSVEKVRRGSGEVVWRVRWRQHGRNRARTFGTRRDASDFDAEVRRQRRSGGLAALDAGTETLGDYVTGAWAISHAVTLAPKTRVHDASLYDHHLRPYLAAVPLREISPEIVGRWQADRLAAGSGPVAVRQAMDLLGSILEHAFIIGRVSENSVRRVRKAMRPRREEVRALSPGTIEAMRTALGVRDASLISVLAYAGLRPGEALGLRWSDVRERTLLVQRAVSLGEEADTKTR